MAKILRKTQKIFGQNGDTDEFAQFGTMKLIENGGTPTYSKDIEVLQNNAAFLLGWQNAVIAGFAPFLEELNALSYILTTQMAYILQNGIPEWDEGTTYYINSIVVGSNSKIYRCKTDDCLNVDPTTDDGTNWYDYELNAANLALSNLNADGVAFVNNSKALETGSVSSNSTVYSDILKYNHSTYDSTKFTVTGTPTISDDGIVSGFTTSNYLSKSNAVTISSSGEFKINFNCKSVIGSDIQYIFDLYNSNDEIVVRRMTNNTYMFLVFINGSNIVSQSIEDSSDDITGFVEYKNGEYTFNINGEQRTATATQLTAASFNLSLGVRMFSGFPQQALTDGSIDLKNLSFYIGGIPVFNGNKTGIDTIKPDDYTVVGTPTISSDGVASGFSNSNYLTTPNIDFSGNTTKVRARFKTGTLGTNTQLIFDSSYIKMRLIYVSAETKFYLSAYFGDGTYSTQPRNTSNAIQENTEYIAEAELVKGVSARVTLYNVDGTIIENSQTSSGQTTSVNIPSSAITADIGYVNNSYFTGSIDLNLIEIYTNDDLVYQPCLKIPYILSKTGSKVVDVYARNRVASMYEQYGYAPYYTIDEANANFTLPMGEVYGLMNQKTNEAPLIKAYGVSINGALTNTNGVLSGFSTSKYAIVSGAFNPANSTWEMNFKVTTGASVSGEQEVFSDGNNGLELQLYDAKWALEFNGNTVGTGTYTVLANTTYYLRLKFTGSAYTLEYSTDGSAYTTDITYSNSTAYTGGILFLGLDKNIESQAWGGSIDLNKCNIKINNTLSWQGVEPKDNVYVINDRPAVVIESFNNGSAWYRLYSDGWCEQGGIIPVGMVTGTSGEHLINVNLLKAYATSNFHINGTVQGDGVTSYILYDIVIVPYSKNTNSVTFSVSPTANNSFFVPYFYWEAKGYTK